MDNKPEKIPVDASASNNQPEGQPGRRAERNPLKSRRLKRDLLKNRFVPNKKAVTPSAGAGGGAPGAAEAESNSAPNSAPAEESHSSSLVKQ